VRFLSKTWRVVATVVVAGMLALPTAAVAATGMAAATAPVASQPASNPLYAPSAGSAANSTSVANSTDGPQFYNGTAVDVTGTIDGDVYAAGQSVTISGTVNGDVIAAAQSITITGKVNGNVRLAGGSVIISGDITRSGTIFAGSVNITNTGSIASDLVSAAGDIAIAGEVGRDLFVSTGQLSIDGTVGGNVTYTSDTAARIADGAVDGTVEHIKPQQTPTVEPSPWAVFLGWLLGLLYGLVASSLVTIAAGLLVPRVLRRVTDQLVPSPWKALLVGFVASVAVPIALLALLISIIGAPLAFAGLLVWLVLTLATFVYGAYYLGRLLFRGHHHPVVTALLGGLILFVALQVPWLNVLVWAAMVYFGLGAQLLAIFAQRPWHSRVEAVNETS